MIVTKWLAPYSNNNSFYIHFPSYKRGGGGGRQVSVSVFSVVPNFVHQPSLAVVLPSATNIKLSAYNISHGILSLDLMCLYFHNSPDELHLY